MDRTKSIQLLNKAVADELQAVHQYMYFHFHLDDQGFAPLSNLFKRIAIQEMMHVEVLAERILFLKGDVEMVPAGPVEKITAPEAILAKAIAMEEDGSKPTTKLRLNVAPTRIQPRSSCSKNSWAMKRVTSINMRSRAITSSASV